MREIAKRAAVCRLRVPNPPGEQYDVSRGVRLLAWEALRGPGFTVSAPSKPRG